MPTDPSVRLYVSRWCVQCERAAALLERRKIAFETIDIGDPDGCCRLHELTGGRSVPQAIVDGRPIGGYEELAALVHSGELSGTNSGSAHETGRRAPSPASGDLRNGPRGARQS